MYCFHSSDFCNQQHFSMTLYWRLVHIVTTSNQRLLLKLKENCNRISPIFKSDPCDSDVCFRKMGTFFPKCEYTSHLWRKLDLSVPSNQTLFLGCNIDQSFNFVLVHLFNIIQDFEYKSYMFQLLDGYIACVLTLSVKARSLHEFRYEICFPLLPINFQVCGAALKDRILRL